MNIESKPKPFSTPSRTSSSMTKSKTTKTQKKSKKNMLSVFVGGIVLGGCLMYNFKTLFDLTTTDTTTIPAMMTKGENPQEDEVTTTKRGGSGGRYIPTTAQEVIDDAYENTFQDLLEYCGPGNHRISKQTEEVNMKEYYSNYLPGEWYQLKNCIMELYQLGFTNKTLNKKWPWWFMTLLRDSINPGHVFGGWHWIVPHPNMGLCMYEKGGSKKWRQLSCAIHINNTETIVHESECRKAGRAWNPPNTKIQQVVFLRDPLDRFLSGFLDKCVHYHSNPLNEQHCEPSIIFQGDGYNVTALTNDFKTQDPKKLFEIYVETFPLQWNIHFIPLSLHCGGLYNSLPYYDFVGQMGSNFYTEIQRLVKKFPHIKAAADLVFQSEKKSEKKVQNVGVETQAASKVTQYYTPKTLRRVLQYTSMDYKLLGIPIPEWAENMLLNDTE